MNDIVRKEAKATARRQKELTFTGSEVYLRYRENVLSREAFLEKKKGIKQELEAAAKLQERLKEQVERNNKEM